MERSHGPIHDVCSWAAHGADGRAGRRAAAAWGVSNPDLAGYASAGCVVRAGRADRDREGRLVAALAAVGPASRTSTLAAVAILAPRLQLILGRSARAGGGDGVDDLEADLVAEVLSLLSTRDLVTDPERLVATAWAGVRNRVRLQRRHADRAAPLDEVSGLEAAPARPAIESAAGVIVDAVRAGRLSPLLAQAVYSTRVAGWPTVEAAARLGCTVGAFRVRRARALTALAA